MPNHFYVSLPSNSSLQYYGRQDASNYITKLATPITIDPSQWEVGLVEFCYPTTWNNVVDGEVKVIVPRPGHDALSEIKVGKIRATRADNPTTLMKVLTGALDEALGEEHKGKIALNYDYSNGGAVVNLEARYAVIFPVDINIQLGFGGAPYTQLVNDGTGKTGPTRGAGYAFFTGNKVTSTYRVDTERMRRDLYVYSDVVEHQRVGDTVAPLLRHVVHSHGSRELVEVSFVNIHYVPVSRGYFDSIEIQISDGTGEKISFEHGDTLCKLHFRRIKSG